MLQAFHFWQQNRIFYTVLLWDEGACGQSLMWGNNYISIACAESAGYKFMFVACKPLGKIKSKKLKQRINHSFSISSFYSPPILLVTISIYISGHINRWARREQNDIEYFGYSGLKLEKRRHYLVLERRIRIFSSEYLWWNILVWRLCVMDPIPVHMLRTVTAPFVCDWGPFHNSAFSTVDLMVIL